MICQLLHFVQIHSSSIDSDRLWSSCYMFVLPQDGNNLLHEAAWGNCSSVIGELVKAGLDVNIVNKVSESLVAFCVMIKNKVS